MTPDIATRFSPPTTQPGISAHEQASNKTPGEHGNQVSGDFRTSLDTPSANIQTVNPTDQINPANSVDSTQRVNRGNIPDKQDMFGQFDKIRGEFDAFLQRSGELDKAVADGKVKISDPKVTRQRREEMRMLLHFQSEMQGTAMKVEIASKVVESGTSGVKTVLSTQA